ncbi:hypothetical protein PR001_g9825 [Phytophthora rubi]|uniref:Uncharacterized protein n=1 Tax=Phytophthora rubi TaxID=129364 RepID=A0A6A3MXU1_9STRA|nr:hypothetical protein PR001_g9825 [Phytophthora rubi]
MIADCWRLGAALYLLVVWRWRVAHFAAHNDVSPEYHVAGLQHRLHNWHRDITGDYAFTFPPRTGTRLSTAVCTMLGADWTDPPGRTPRTGHCYLLAVAGHSGEAPRRCSNASLVVKIHPITGTFVVQYMSSATYKRETVTLIQAIHLGKHYGDSGGAWPTSEDRCNRG